MEKILRVNMSDLSTKVEDVPAAWARYGGRALTSTIVAAEVPPTCHPLGPNNKLVFAPGLLSGTTGADVGRLSAGAKSPLTGGIKESSAGGLAAQMLAKLGIKALIIEGQPKEDKWYRIHINKDGATIREEKKLVGKGNFAVVEALEAELGKKFGSLSIGQAGEYRLGGSSIAVRDIGGKLRCHGRGGMGAVMGSKKIKLISIDDTGAPGVPLADPEKFKAASKVWAKALLEHPGLGQGMKNLGTAMMVNIINAYGALPTRNFSNGQFEQKDNISGETMHDVIEARHGETTHNCQPGCVIQCSQVYTDKDGKYVTSGFEYETLILMGSNCGVGDLDGIAEADYLMDDVGLDSIELGAAFGVAMQAGVLPFGDIAGMKRIIKEDIAQGTPLGRILGSGAGMVGKVYGMTRVPVAKNQAMPAYDPRPIKGIGITYATTPMGADHTAGYAVGPTVGGHINGSQKPGQVDVSRFTQITSAAMDSVGICTFADMALADIADAKPAMVDMLNARLGTQGTVDDHFDAVGKYVLKTERQFNLAAGFSKADDRLPEFLTSEPLPPKNDVWDFTGEEIDAFWNF